MAIKIQRDTPDALDVQINNGDLNALNELVKKWGFKDKESALRFAIAVLFVNKPGTLLQEQDDKKITALMPTDTLTSAKENNNG